MLIALLGAKGAPGATTAALALGRGWPRQVVVADCDPAGGDMIPGMLAGRAGLDRGLLSFATATRHARGPAGEELMRHLLLLPETPGMLLLPGLQNAREEGSIDTAAWRRLSSSLRSLGDPEDSAGYDAICDCGRLSARTPWPLAADADLVLLVVRPTVRSCLAARQFLPTVRGMLGDLDRVRLLVTGHGSYPAREVADALGLPAGIELPDDPKAAEVLSDGEPAGRGFDRSQLMRAARTAAASLHSTLIESSPTAGSGPGRPDGAAARPVRTGR